MADYDNVAVGGDGDQCLVPVKTSNQVDTRCWWSQACVSVCVAKSLNIALNGSVVESEHNNLETGR